MSKFSLGDRVRKHSGSWWEGRIVGTYSTLQTPEGYCVQFERENGPVQIYPAAALERISNMTPDLIAIPHDGVKHG